MHLHKLYSSRCTFPKHDSLNFYSVVKSPSRSQSVDFEPIERCLACKSIFPNNECHLKEMEAGIRICVRLSGRMKSFKLVADPHVFIVALKQEIGMISLGQTGAFLVHRWITQENHKPYTISRYLLILNLALSALSVSGNFIGPCWAVGGEWRG